MAGQLLQDFTSPSVGHGWFCTVSLLISHNIIGVAHENTASGQICFLYLYNQYIYIHIYILCIINWSLSWIHRGLFSTCGSPQLRLVRQFSTHVSLHVCHPSTSRLSFRWPGLRHAAAIFRKGLQHSLVSFNWCNDLDLDLCFEIFKVKMFDSIGAMTTDIELLHKIVDG